MAKLYRALELPEFSAVEPALRRYLGSINRYRKNVFPEFAAGLKARVSNDWRPYFKEWGYAT